MVVLDLTHFVAGPYCTMLLADHGATVIKVEAPGGEPTRHIAPLVGSEGGGLSVYFARLNRNKESICVDLSGDRGREVLADLVRRADVLVENFRAGALERLGFSAERLAELNERLVYCSISGFGHTPGPYRDRPAFAPVVEAMAAVTRHNPGGPPMTMGVAVGDLYTGAMAFGAINMALLERVRTGRGRHLDLAMYDSMLSLNERAVVLRDLLDIEAQPGAPTLASTPSDIFRTRDGYVVVSVVGEHIWARLCAVIGDERLASHPGLQSAAGRAELYDDVLLPILDAWLSQRTTAEVIDALFAGGVPAGEVMTAGDVLASEHTALRNMLVRNPSYAGVDVVGPASPIPWGVEPRTDPIPAAGRQTESVLRDLAGYDAATIEQLMGAGVVQGTE